MKPIYPGMKAQLAQGGTAAVVDVLYDPDDGTRRALVISINGYFGPDVVVPISAVWHVDEQVHLALTKADVADLSHHDPAHYGEATGRHGRAHTAHGKHAHAAFAGSGEPQD
jgi:hypothetical protein